MGFLNWIFFGSLDLRVPGVEENSGSRTVPPVKCYILYQKVNGFHDNISELTMASSRSDIVCSGEAKVTSLRHVSQLLLFGFRRPLLIVRRGSRPNGLGVALNVREGFFLQVG